VSSDADYPEVAAVPSMPTAGLTELNIAQWYGLFAPPGTPHAIVNQINADLVAMLSRAEIVDQLRADGATPVGGTPHDLAQLLVTESRRWRQVIGKLHGPTLAESVE
jgi:tripartite-type tricarboxylate transporter receptor subunit TctC